MAGPLGDAAQALGGSRAAARRARGPRASALGAAQVARRPADGGHPARRGRAGGRRGLPAARPQRGQSAGAAAPRPRAPARRARHVHGGMTVREPEITCREFVDLVTDYQEGALEADALDLVEEHLVLCDWCRDYLDQLEATVAATARILDDPPPAEVLESVMTAFRSRHGRTA